MTPKQRVLKKWSDAYAHHCLFFPFNWRIIRPNRVRLMGEGDTAAQAWANAARNLK